MSDALPAEYGADLSKRGPRGRMLPDARAAHERLASLPTVRHEWKYKPRDETPQQKSQRAADTAKRNGTHKPGARLTISHAIRVNAPIGRTQRDRILAMLQQGPQTLDVLREQTGGKKVASRVCELRDAGWDITAERHDGVTTYTLRGKA